MKKNIFLYVALGIFLAVFIVCAVIIVDYLIDVARERELHSSDKLGNIGSILEDTENTPAPVWTRNPQSVSNPNAADSVVQTGNTILTNPETEETTGTSGENTENVPSDTTQSVPSDSTESPEIPSIPSDTTSVVEPSDTVTPPTTDPIVPEDTTTVETTTVTTPPPVETEPPEDESTYSEKFKQIRAELLALNAKYPDIMGYISIPCLGISYPLMNRPEDTSNLYYLTHDETGREQKAGSIYTDFRVNRNPLKNKNIVIYGHNMRTGSMFGTLSKLVTSEKLFGEAEVIIATLNGIFTYKVFSAYRTNAYDTYCTMSFADDTAYGNFLNGIVNKSVFKSTITDIGVGDKIITLSTCTNITETGRYAVHAVLVKIEK